MWINGSHLMVIYRNIPWRKVLVIGVPRTALQAAAQRHANKRPAGTMQQCRFLVVLMQKMNHTVQSHRDTLEFLRYLREHTLFLLNAE